MTKRGGSLTRRILIVRLALWERAAPPIEGCLELHPVASSLRQCPARGRNEGGIGDPELLLAANTAAYRLLAEVVDLAAPVV